MEQLVGGDVVILQRGDQVPADAVVLTSDSLELDESLLTGENDPIACKRPGDMVLSASSVLGGTARPALSRGCGILVQARFLMRRVSSRVFSLSCVMR